jgi:transposase InsO family protein
LSAPAKGVNSTQGRPTCPLVGPLQKAPGGYTHLLVAIDKFSKWIEVRPLNSIRSEQAMAFFTNIIHRFGVSNSIITDNGTQFTGRKFLDFCKDHHIRVDWAAVAHPMTNGQVERGNGMILQGLKPRIYNDLNKFGKRWIIRGEPPLRQNFPRKRSFCQNVFRAFRLLRKWDPENDGVHVSIQG